MDQERIFRNHFSMVIQNMIYALLILGLFFTGLVGLIEEHLIIVLFVSIFFVSTFFIIRWWCKTTYSFTETGIEIEIDTFFKKHKNIPYAKLASVNVSRTMLSHVFGTSVLKFNVDSSVNSNVAEGSLCLKKDVADSLKKELDSHIFRGEADVSDDDVSESLIRVTNTDVLIHSFLGQPTAQQLFGLLMLGYSIIGLIADSVNGFFIPFMMFLFGEGVPLVQMFLKYYNYRIYRRGDLITVESGLINNYHTSFKTNRINSVKIYQPFLTRLCGRSILMGEVIGLAEQNELPLLCPAKSDRQVRELMGELIPEFQCDMEPVSQPKSALVPMFIINLIIILISLVSLACAYVVSEPYLPAGDRIVSLLEMLLFLIPAILIIVMPIGRIVLSQNHRSLAIRGGICMIVHGSYDLNEEYVNLDKIQFSTVTSGILQRRFGLGTCTVNLMSSSGAATVRSGLFPVDDLEDVGKTIMSRIEDGSYDPRDYYRSITALVGDRAVI